MSRSSLSSTSSENAETTVPLMSSVPRVHRYYSDPRILQRTGEFTALSPTSSVKPGAPPGLPQPVPRRTGSETSSWRNGVDSANAQTPTQKSALEDFGAFGRSGHSRSQSRGSSPGEYRHSVGQWLNCVPEDSEMPVDRSPSIRPAATPRSMQHSYYGSFAYPSSLEVEEAEDLDEEEEEWIVEDELAKDGLYRGNYKNLVLFYTFVPLSTLLGFVVLALLPVLAFRSRSTSSYPYLAHLPFPFPEVLTSAALWSLSYLLRDTIYSCSISLTAHLLGSFPSVASGAGSLFASILQSGSTIILRQLALPILLVPFYSSQSPITSRHIFPTWEDAAFRRVWCIALGWAAAEAIVGIKQGYENIALYKDVLVSIHRISAKPEGQEATQSRGRVTSPVDVNVTPTQGAYSGQNIASAGAQSPRRDPSSSLSSRGSSAPIEDLSTSAILGENQPLLTLKRPPPLDPGSLTRRSTNESARLLAESEVEQDFETLMRLNSREELEDLYGIPFIRIPIFISCLHRINSILSSLGVCLLLSGAYLRSTLAIYPPGTDSSSQLSPRLATLFPSDVNTLSGLVPSADGGIGVVSPDKNSNRPLWIVFLSLLLLQTVMSMMHTAWVLPRIGIHTFVYIGLLVWLGVFFGALGYWEVLS